MRNAGKQVIFVQAVLGEMQSSYGIWAFQVPDALGPAPGDLYVTKELRDSFDKSTALVGLLNERELGSCIITGIATHACVNGTVQGGMQRGYRIIVAADAHSSYDPGAQDRIDTYNGVVWPSMGAIVMESDAITFDTQQ